MKITPGIYRSVSTVALPLASLYLMWRSRRQPAYRDYWDERFAWGTYPLRTERPRVWIHAVSVGETNAAKPLLEAMLKSWPECDVVLTHMTPTGREAGKRLVRLAPERIRQCYLPYDAPYAVEKFVRQVRPTLGVIMETEVWPNLMHEMTAHGIPVVLANARESEKSRAQAQKAIEVMGPAFGSFAAVLAQSDEDKARLESLGAKDVLVTGSVKFDIVPDASQMAAAKAWLTVLSRPVVLLASTRDGEEAAFLESFKKHPALLAETLVVVVPRHPERFERVVELFESAGSPVVVGPSIFNFERIIREGIAAGGMVQAMDAEAAVLQLEQWLKHPEERNAAGAAAKNFAQKCAGATARMMTVLEKLWTYARKNESRMS